LPAGIAHFGDRGLHIAATARVYPTVVLDCEHGPVVIEEHAVVRPGAVICGPAYVGPHSTVLDCAVIRGNTAIGPHCKVAGEVSGTVFQGYANKAHDGFLGDSWVGEWVNLGAGTTNSNLLNTYSEIICRATPEGPNERTGETFLGAVVGDHVKTAICTRIMTGAILHTGSMFATTAPISGTVARFTWATDAGSRAYRFDKFLDVARAAMARRKVEPSAAYIERLRALHEGR
jgi:UDP-N-acetylglucosamine diphosphorylase/glucosamine-1-phosphate N-acetyltransferase